MSIRRTFFAALCFAVLASLAWWDFISRDVTDMTDFAERTLLEIGFEEITAFTVDNPNGHFELEMRDDGWWLTEPLETMADQTWAAIILSNMADAKRHSAIEGIAADRLGEYGLADPLIQATFRAADGRQTSIAIGDQSATTNRFFATEPGTDQIFTISGHVLGNLDKTLLQLRNKHVFSVFPDGIPEAIEVVSTLAGVSRVEATESGSWMTSGDFPRNASPSVISELLEEIMGLQAVDFIDADEVDEEEIGLTPPLMRLAIFTDTGESLDLDIGYPLSLRGEEFYARVPGADQIITIPGRSVGMLPRRSIDWIDRNLFHLDPNALGQITLIVRQVADVGGDATVQLERNEYGFWQLSSSPTARINQNIVADLIRLFARLSADEINVVDPPSLTDFGLQRPILSFIARSLDEESMVHIDQGSSVGQGEGQAFFRHGGDTVVYIAPQVYDDANLLRIQLVNRHLVAGDLTQVTRIVYQREGVTLEFVYDEGVWTWVEGDRIVPPDRLQRAFSALDNSEYRTLMEGEQAAVVRAGMTEPAWSLALFDSQNNRLSDLRTSSVPSLTEVGDQMIVLIDGELSCWVDRAVMTRIQSWLEQLVRG